MKDKYIIINKITIQKRIEELENAISKCILPEQQHLKDLFEQELEIKTQILSQSTPLIPELQKTWNTAYIDAVSIDEETYKPLFFEDYISNLKLDI